ncbi:hypothetical protein Tdes44962_MAKER07947 [Teratosphaeria destructans]|uniref:Uncharacterized protein n=1 Tax=Teratosphaeria destructans TaxID=418781 RepID=A0A9W7SXZ6_9PEZI|nr:hypothetical protein Tdes44962_MAKER07947 [Teratosphaeria destructans]
MAVMPDGRNAERNDHHRLGYPTCAFVKSFVQLHVKETWNAITASFAIAQQAMLRNAMDRATAGPGMLARQEPSSVHGRLHL